MGLFLLAIVSENSLAHAQNGATPQELVADVRVEGNRAVSTAKVMSQIETRAGRPYNEQTVARDVRFLAARGWFVDVRPVYKQTPQGRVVIFRVVERPTLRYVKFLGAESIRVSKLAKESGLKVGDAVDPYAINAAKEKVLKIYHKAGYGRVSVKVIEGTRPSDHGAVFVINEGPRQKIFHVSFTGNTVASDARLKTQIKSKPGFFWYGGYTDHEKIDNDIKNITNYYRNLGYIKARVGRELEYNEDRSWVNIVFVIDEGPRYKVRNVSFVGNKKFATKKLLDEVELQQGAYFNKSQLNTDVARLRDAYGSDGYVFADIQPDIRYLEEPGQLDLIYDIEEGDRYRVGRITVHVQGESPHTKIQTVLNRLSIKTNDIVNIREVRASERRLRSSGLYLNEPGGGKSPRITFTPPGANGTQVANRPRPRGQSPEEPVRKPSQDEIKTLHVTMRPNYTLGRTRFDAQGRPVIDFDIYEQQSGRVDYTLGEPMPGYRQPAEQSPIQNNSSFQEPAAEPVDSADEARKLPAPTTCEREGILCRGQSPESFQPGRFGSQPLRPLGPSAKPFLIDARPSGSSQQRPVASYNSGNSPSGGASFNRPQGSIADGAAVYPNRSAPLQPASVPQGNSAYFPAANDQGPHRSPPVSIRSLQQSRAFGNQQAQYPVQRTAYRNRKNNAGLVVAGQSPDYPNTRATAFNNNAGGSQNVQTGFNNSATAPVDNSAATTGQSSPFPTATTRYQPITPIPGNPNGQNGANGGNNSGGVELFPGPGGGGYEEVTPLGVSEQAIPFDVFVEETQTGRFMLGVGVNSDAGVVGSVTIDEQNFDWRRWPTSIEDFRNGTAFRGAGQRFRVELQPGTQVQRYLINFSEPYLFDTPVSFGISGFFFDRRYEDWDEQRLGGRVSLGYQLTHDLSIAAAYRSERVNIHDPSTLAVPELNEVLGDNQLYGFKATIAHDTRDSAFLATEGHLIEVSGEYVIGTFQYPRAEIDVRQYFLVTERPDRSGRHVISVGGRAGFSGSDTPIYDHFFIGGFSTLRGFDFRSATPVQGGVFLGGEFMLIGSVEYLIPITADDMLRAVAFVDAGTVEEDIEINNFRVAPGVGLRITVPAMGPAPIALDFAFPVVKADTDRTRVFTFNVGWMR